MWQSLVNLMHYPLTLPGIPPAPLGVYAFFLLVVIASNLVRLSKSTKAQNITQLIARIVLKLPAVGAWIALVPALGDALRALAMAQTVIGDDPAALPQTLIMHLASRKAPEAQAAVSPGRTIKEVLDEKKLVAIFLIPLFALSVGGCLPKPSQCIAPIPAALLKKCSLENNLIACGEQDGYALLPVILEVVASLVASAFDPAALVTMLEQQGVQDVPCVLAAIEDYFGANSAMSEKLDAALRVAVARKGLHGSVTVKLKNGHAKTVVVQ